MLPDPRMGVRAQQVSLNRKERPVRLGIIVVYLAIALGFGTAREYFLPALVIAASIIAAEPFDRLYLKAPSRSRYLMCIAWCLVDGVLPCWIYFMIMSGGDAFSLFLTLTMIWVMTSQCLIVRSHDLRVYALTVVPGFLGFGATILWADTEVISADLKPLVLICTVLQLVFALQSGWVSRRIKRELFRALSRANAAGQAKDKFFAMITHEIRTPLNGILGTGQMMSHEAISPVEKDRAQTIMASGTAMRTLLDDLLNQAKLEAGQFVIRPAPMQISGTVQTVVSLFGDAASAEGITLDHTVAPNVPPWIMGDATRVQQILSNLVSNAVKHTDTGRIEIAVSRRNVGHTSWLDIAVSDTGPGIPEDALQRIFEPYRQLDDAVAAAGIGTGLGLAIARDLARAMGGDLDVASTIGQGSIFTISLPAEAASGTGEETASARETVGSRLSGLQIMVVDDALINRRIARSFLDLVDASVIEAPNGAEALEKLLKEPVDLVLTDMHMPKMGGADLLAAIRAESRIAHLPVICLTADGNSPRVGFDAELGKPLTRNDLYETIAAVMQKRARKAA